MRSVLLSVLVLLAFGCDGGSGNAPVCGDGVQDDGELCDGLDLGDQSCLTMGYLSGSLRCNAQCQFDFTTCSRISPDCGDGTKNEYEECDDADLAGQSCQSLGYESGALGCSDTCEIDVSGCVGEPCIGEHCDDECQEDGNCPDDRQSCVDGACSVICDVDTDCLWDRSDCDDGTCEEIECLSSQNCDLGAVCKSHHCQIVACATDEDCPSGTVCEVVPAGRCVECLEASDCQNPGPHQCDQSDCILQCTDDYADNDSPSKATPLSSDAGPVGTEHFVNFTICGREEQDWYRIELEGGRHYTITAHFDEPALGTGDSYSGVSGRLYAGLDFSEPIAAGALSALHSKDVILTFDTGSEGGEHYLVIELDIRKYEAHYDIDTLVE